MAKRLKIGDTLSMAVVNLVNPPGKSDFRPINDRVILQLDPDVDRSNPGDRVIWEGDSHHISFWGTVVAVGPGRLIAEGPRTGQRVPTEVVPGDRVMYGAGPIRGRTDIGFTGGNSIEWLDRDRRIVSIEAQDCMMVQRQVA